MHPIVFAEFERVCRLRAKPGHVLEIGAVATRESLLTLEALGRATLKVGLTLEPPTRLGSAVILQGNANDMRFFKDASFDTLLCNSVLEHDPSFWLTLAEMRRVTRSGGLMVLGVPGYAHDGELNHLSWTSRIPGLGAKLASLTASTRTLRIHEGPGDYYRFSRQAFAEVLLAGLRDVEIRSVLSPPRFVGAGIRP